jgi:hypothetical protein
MMDHEFIERKNFAAKVEEMMKRDSDKDSEAAAGKGFDFDTFLDEFKAEHTNVPQQMDAALAAAPCMQLADMIKRCEEIAALSGKFDPEQLFAPGVSEEEKRSVLSILTPDCIVEAVTSVQWLLQKKKRIEVLRRMLQAGELKNKTTGSLPSTDAFGRMLRRVIIEGQDMRLNDMSPDELLALVNVLETITELDIPKPHIASVRELLPNRLLDDYVALAKNFIGREGELKQLKDFLSSPHLPDPVADLDFSWEGLVMTGLGGVGKSTLLAKFASDILSIKQASVVILDFDRPGVDPTDISWMESEISKQIGEQYSMQKQKLREARKFAFSQERTLALETSNESARFSKSLIHDVREVLIESGGYDQTFLLILDTVEEAAQRNMIEPLHFWIGTLADELHPLKFKVIFSGRLFDHQLEKLLVYPQVLDKPLDIIAFDETIARQFLRREGLADDTIEKVIASKSVPLRPLELKLISGLLKDGSVTPEDLERDMKEGNSSGAIDELFLGLIYRRVLRRIKEPDVNKIACPGLVLRYINAELVQHVLQPALELSVIDEARAKEILDNLASYTWLAYRDQGKIWHRKDLRRSMLRVMVAKEASSVKAIRDAAIAYFDSLNTPEAAAESMYHKLMMVSAPADVEGFNLSGIAAAYEYIQQDMPDLPKAGAVLLRFASDQKIDELDILLLPDEYFKRAYESIGRRLVSNRQFLQAYEIFKKAQKLNISLVAHGAGILDKWEKELLYAITSWEAVKRLPTYQSIDEKRINLSAVANYVFPAGIIDPSAINRDLLEDILERATEDEKNFLRTVSGPENISIITRLAYCFANLHAASHLSNKIKKCLSRIANSLLHNNRTPSLEKSLFILHYICYGEQPPEFRPGISLLRFDHEWINRLEAFVTKDFHELIRSTANVFAAGEPRFTATGLLTQIDADREKRDLWHKMSIDIKKADTDFVFELVRGPDPIFRDPCCYALIEALEKPEDYNRLAELMQSVIKIRLSDLQPEKFAATVKGNPEQALQPYVEIIDRSWMLGDFIRSAQKAFPASLKMLRVKNAYEKWESSLRSVFFESK